MYSILFNIRVGCVALGSQKPKRAPYMAIARSGTYPLLVMMGYTRLADCSSGVVAATHSSKSSSKG